MILDLRKGHVWVKLTELGLSVFAKKSEYLASMKKAEGWYEFTLGDLIREFGSVTHSGHGTPFEGNKVHFTKPF